MKAILKKSVKDRFWDADDYDMQDLNPMNKTLTNYYLPYLSPSPLKSFLLKKLFTFKQMYLYLKVDCEKDNSAVKSISLECDLLSDWERFCDSSKVNWTKIRECLAVYFLCLGYPCIRCTNDKDIVNFIQRLEKDVPLAQEYFRVLCNYEWEGDMWNHNNEATQVALKYNSGKDVIIPDYGNMCN
ncbi:hypothetical protein [Bacteroides sp.]|uniref:hypothetical protein n=1 Tax=Bacteroides sp. TaxID=29523 RepID=UPI0023C45B6A|nr:hypothetical protein [Bacteroides sp.]MDE6216931.1 hypothetical protein [Bacteroides sp.]